VEVQIQLANNILHRSTAARESAFTARNIKSGWSKTELFPAIRAGSELNTSPGSDTKVSSPQGAALRTPVTSEALTSLRNEIKQHIDVLDVPSKSRRQKLGNAAEKAFAKRALLLNENKLLFEQNNKSRSRVSTRLTVVATAKVMSYGDIVQAQRKRDANGAGVEDGARSSTKRKCSAPKPVAAKRSRGNEI
jgi:hypothetical protein